MPHAKIRNKIICLALPKNELRTAKPNPFLENTGCPLVSITYAAWKTWFYNKHFFKYSRTSAKDHPKCKDLDHMPREDKKQWKIPKPSSKEVVAVAYDKWLLMRGSKYKAFTVKVFFTQVRGFRESFVAFVHNGSIEQIVLKIRSLYQLWLVMNCASGNLQVTVEISLVGFII